MKIIYIGCVESSYKFLEALLLNGADIVGVITKKNSVYNSDFRDITPLCKRYNIPYIYVNNINEAQTINFIEIHKPDIGYCFGWSQLIDDKIINLFPKGMIGYHPAALPNNRGRHPIIWALVLGLKETSSSFFKIEKTADSGEILSQEKLEISYEDDASTLMKKLLDIGSSQIVSLTKQLESDEVIKAIPNKGGNSWRKRNKFDGLIDWRMSSESIYNLVRALTKPYVGAHFIFNNKEIKVWKAKEIFDKDKKYNNIEPGKVKIIGKEQILVKTGDNLIQLLEYDSVIINDGEYLM